MALFVSGPHGPDTPRTPTEMTSGRIRNPSRCTQSIAAWMLAIWSGRGNACQAVVLSVAFGGISTLSTTSVILAGHSGATAAWQKTWTALPPAPPGASDDG